MCGIAGALLTSPTHAISAGPAVRRMSEQMRARGPDSDGFWADEAAGVWLGHRRLAILDLDARANQPMLSVDGRYAMVYNGEIYNFRELRQALVSEGVTLHTQSDSEVLLELFAREGTKMLPRLRGMFAFAIWDRQLHRLFLARDAYGIKPLYLARVANGWLFASQVKALLASTLVSREPDPVGQAGFWLLGSVPEPRTWFRDISLLPAGHYAWITEAGLQASVAWQDIGSRWRDAPNDAGDATEVGERVTRALRDSIRAHMVSDVPVGVFLSGGIDSCTLAALMREAGAVDLQGVTIGFSEFAGGADDEAPLAARAAAQLGIRHHVRMIQRREFVEDWPRILAAMDQPSVDGINSWYASKAVAELGLKVVVSGVGGDELFHGYSSFRDLPPLVSRWSRAAQLPGVVALARLTMAMQSRRTGNPRWKLLPSLARSLPGAWFLRRGVASPEELPNLMGAELAAAVGELDPLQLVQSMVGVLPGQSGMALSQIESMTYLRNQLLRDSDWASMAHSVELRTPLVDAWLLADLQPVLSAFNRFASKSLLSQAPSRPADPEILSRSKTGFGTPVASWLAALPLPGGPTANVRPGAMLAQRVAAECYAT